MKMHKPVKILILIASIIIVSLPAYAIAAKDSSFVIFNTEYAPIEFQFPPGWYKNNENNPYDLQCFSQLQEMNTGVFVFKKIDIAASSTPLDIFWTQVNDLKSKRNNFEVLESIQSYEYDDKTLTTATYIAEKASKRFYYKFTLIEFKADDSKFAVALQVAIPGQWEKNKAILEKITQSARSLHVSD